MSLKLTLSLVLIAMTGTLLAGEVQLRSQATVSGSVVRVGDVADPVDLSDSQWNALAQVELFPVPAEGEPRLLSAATARELIALRLGDEAAAIPITGQCRVLAGEARRAVSSKPNKKQPSRTEPTSMVRPRRDEERRFTPRESGEALLNSPAGRGDALARTMSIARQRLVDAATAYLSKQSSDLSTWTLDFDLDNKQAEQLAHGEAVSVTGPKAPWTGRQLLTVEVDGAKWFNIKATIGRHVMIQVAKHDLRAGEVLSDEDLEEVSTSEIPAGSSFVGSRMYVMGGESVGEKTLLQPIAAGSPIPRAALKKTLVVTKGELITVYAVAAGIKIKSTAKALADAASGELVLLEEPTTKKQFQARATAHQEAMVLVDVPKVPPMGGQTDREQALRARANRQDDGGLLESRPTSRSSRRR
jgi:flagella basal body P-ring formation protein FlgA